MKLIKNKVCTAAAVLAVISGSTTVEASGYSSQEDDQVASGNRARVAEQEATATSAQSYEEIYTGKPCVTRRELLDFLRDNYPMVENFQPEIKNGVIVPTRASIAGKLFEFSMVAQPDIPVEDLRAPISAVDLSRQISEPRGDVNISFKVYVEGRRDPVAKVWLDLISWE